MAFSADRALEALDYDFRPYVKCHGTIAEPSDDQVHAMNAALRDAVVALTGEGFDPEDRAAAAKVFASLTDEQLRAMDAESVNAVAHVTGLNPSPEDIAALPYRIKRAFIGWLTMEINDPEGRTTATRP